MHFTLADLIVDITQNGAEAGASLVELHIIETADEFRFIVKDNGKGMTEEELKKAIDPFVTDGIKHPGRRVGLGLPFLIQTAEQSGGGWDIKSEKEGLHGSRGTTVTAWFDSSNFDMPPVGDIPKMFRAILMFDTKAEIVIRRKKADGDEYEVSKSELIDAIGSLEDVGNLVLLGEYLEGLEE